MSHKGNESGSDMLVEFMVILAVLAVGLWVMLGQP